MVITALEEFLLFTFSIFAICCWSIQLPWLLLAMFVDGSCLSNWGIRSCVCAMIVDGAMDGDDEICTRAPEMMDTITSVVEHGGGGRSFLDF